jgi:hypothetical protein
MPGLSRTSRGSRWQSRSLHPQKAGEFGEHRRNGFRAIPKSLRTPEGLSAVLKGERERRADWSAFRGGDANEEIRSHHRGAVRAYSVRCFCWRLKDSAFVWSGELHLGSIFDYSHVRERSRGCFEATHHRLHLTPIERTSDR